MCLAIPGKVVEILENHGVRMAGRFRRHHVARPAWSTCPRPSRRLRAGPRRLRDQRGGRRGGARGRIALPRGAGPARRARGDRSPAMKYLDEYRDGRVAAEDPRRDRRAVTRPWTLMEVCGGQTHSIVKYGIDRLLPAGDRAGARPRLPRVRDAAREIDRAHAIARRPDVIFCLVRRHAARARAREATCSGCEPRAPTCEIVYSPLDAVKHRAGAPRPRGGVLRASASRPPRRPTRMAVTQARGARRRRTSRCSSRTCWCRRRSPPSCSRRGNRVQGFLGPGPRLRRDGHARVRGRSPTATACPS